MPLTKPRYDGYADWYDNWNRPHAERNAADVLDLLGPGAGLCLDLGCGSGLYFDVLTATGRTVVGLDRSAVAALWISTDVDDFAAVLREVARVLTPGGLMVCCGAHPCFNGPHTQWLDDGGIVAHPTYRLAGWHQEAPWWGPYIRRRVGMRHHPLAEVLNAFVGAGLAIEHVAELGDRPVPANLAIRARKPEAALAGSA
jgi:SAM-dependent methyltransferase